LPIIILQTFKDYILSETNFLSELSLQRYLYLHNERLNINYMLILYVWFYTKIIQFKIYNYELVVFFGLLFYFSLVLIVETTLNDFKMK
jgi:hypothetical protein